MGIVMNNKWEELPYLPHYIYVMVSNTLYCKIITQN